MAHNLSQLNIIIRGAGELASATAHRLFASGLKRIVMTEREKPLAIRRRVCFSEAVYEDFVCVESVGAELIADSAELNDIWANKKIAVTVDPELSILDQEEYRPHILIDAMMAKMNLGTRLDMAELVIALGPGFFAGRDVHFVIETNRGHDLGRIIDTGCAQADTGIPGEIAGQSRLRIVRSPGAGTFFSLRVIGDSVEKGDVVGHVDSTLVRAPLSGVIRGLIRDGVEVTPNLKIGDIDPRSRIEYCDTISDKGRTISGAVLETIMSHFNV